MRRLVALFACVFALIFIRFAFICVLVYVWQSNASLILQVVVTPPLLFMAWSAGPNVFRS